MKITHRIEYRAQRSQDQSPFVTGIFQSAPVAISTLGSVICLKKSIKVTDIFLSALAHDLYEDTPIDPAVIRTQFGVRVDDWIRYLTNEEGDDFRENYIRKIASSPEEVKLIKLADVTDNTASCAYGLHDLGAVWVKEQYLPHMVEMRNVITADCFHPYPRTASILIQNLQFACERLEHNLKKW